MRFLGLGNGSDGVVALGSYTQTWYSASATSGQKDVSVTGTFSAGDRVFIHQTRGGSNVGKGEENTVASYVAGTLTLVHPLENTYTDSGSEQAQIAVVEQASSVTGTYTVPVWDGDVGGIFYMSCNGVFDGIVNGDEKGFRGGQQINGTGATNVYGYSGEGSVGASSVQSTRDENGNGAGSSFSGSSVNHGAGGSGGGNATVGTNGEGFGGTGGDGGAEVATETLATIFLGGGGSSGIKTNSGTNGLSGGLGGGIIIVNTNTISASASLSADGKTGTSNATGTSHAAGGGGAGGSILIRCIKNLGATLSATKGSGGTTTATNQDGGDGSEGRIRIESCSNTTGTEDPTASTSIGGHNYCGILGGMI